MWIHAQPTQCRFDIGHSVKPLLIRLSVGVKLIMLAVALILQPLLDMASNGLTNGIDEDMVIALKALGNAGHPLSLKTIMKFLPGFSIKAESLSNRVQSVAVQALRNLAIRDPHNVRITTSHCFLMPKFILLL